MLQEEYNFNIFDITINFFRKYLSLLKFSWIKFSIINFIEKLTNFIFCFCFNYPTVVTKLMCRWLVAVVSCWLRKTLPTGTEAFLIPAGNGRINGEGEIVWDWLISTGCKGRTRVERGQVMDTTGSNSAKHLRTSRLKEKRMMGEMLFSRMEIQFSAKVARKVHSSCRKGRSNGTKLKARFWTSKKPQIKKLWTKRKA